MKSWLGRIRWKTVLAAAMGSLVYVLLGLLLSFRVGPAPLEFKCAVPVFVGAAFGPAAGFAAGVLGEVMLGISQNSLWWSMALATGLAGLGVGLLLGRTDVRAGQVGKREILAFCAAALLCQLTAFGLVCPLLDMLLYSEAAANIFLRGLIEGAANGMLSILPGVPALLAFGRLQKRKYVI